MTTTTADTTRAIYVPVYEGNLWDGIDTVAFTEHLQQYLSERFPGFEVEVELLSGSGFARPAVFIGLDAEVRDDDPDERDIEYAIQYHDDLTCAVETPEYEALWLEGAGEHA